MCVLYYKCEFVRVSNQKEFNKLIDISNQYHRKFHLKTFLNCIVSSIYSYEIQLLLNAFYCCILLQMTNLKCLVCTLVCCIIFYLCLSLCVSLVILAVVINSSSNLPMFVDTIGDILGSSSVISVDSSVSFVTISKNLTDILEDLGGPAGVAGRELQEKLSNLTGM